MHVSTLFQKLNHYSIRRVALQLVKGYLYKRQMYVAVNNVNSEILEINQHGVPQGSVLGPLLLIIYVNGMAHGLDKGQCIQFTDDSTIFIQGKNIKYVYMNVELRTSGLTPMH